jgi:hypothetical protein
VARGGDPIAEDPVNLTARKSQQPCQRAISGLLPPLSEQMKDEEQRCRFCPSGRFQREVIFDLFEEQRQHLDTLSRCSLQNASLGRPSA